MDELYTRFDSVFFEKTRLSLMTVLYQEGRAAFTTLKERLEMTDGALYTHLEKLIKAGYVEKKKELAGMSVSTVYSLTKEGRRLFRDYLKFIGGVLKSMESEKTGN